MKKGAKPKKLTKSKNKKTAEADHKPSDENEIEIFYENSYNKFIEQYGLEELFLYKFNNELLVKRPENFITDDKISYYEFTRVVAERAKQIEDGAPIFIDIRDGTNPIQIAIQEIKEKKCPLSVRRDIGLNNVEIYKVNDMSSVSEAIPE